jgi:nicotinic acid mononucleotide adenylyltransferase
LRRKRAKIDKVILLPSGVQPHKTSGVNAKLRTEMIRAAARPYGNLIIDDLELNFNGTAYASDVLPLIKEKYGILFIL